MSPLLPPVTDLIRDARRAVRREGGVAIAAALLTLAPAVLIIAWLLAGWPGWLSPSPAPLLVDLLVVLIGAAFFTLAVRELRRRTSEREIAGAAEAGADLPRGSVSGVLELSRGVPPGTSVALFERTERALRARFADRRAVEVSGDAGRIARSQRRRALAGLAIACAAAVGLALVSPERSRAGWPALFQPLAHLSGPVLPALAVEPGDVDVPRGTPVEVRVRAAGRFAVTVHHRAEGDVPRSETVAVIGDSAAVQFPVDARTVYWVAAPDGATSPQYVATPLDPLLVSELVVEVRYPPHAGRLPERYETEVPPIEVPEGTTLAVSGRATLRLDEASLVGAGSSVPLAIDGERFAATWTPTVSALWEWRLESRLAGAPGTLPPPLDVTVVPDAPPQVAMTFPARDTILDATRIQPLAADAEDDFGIRAAALVWRIVRNGEAGAPVETPVPFDSTGTRVFIRGVLDARELDLLPGDTIRYFVRVTDNGPRAQTASSATWSLYLPGRPEMRERAEDELARAVEETRNLSQSARALQDATRDLQRRTQAAQARNEANASGASRQGQAGQQGSLGFKETEQARQVLEQQKELAARLDEMRQRLEAMEKSLENAALRDPKLEAQLQELRKTYDQMLNPELQQQMQQLQDALDTLDPQELEKALDELAARQQQIREQLQQSLDQLRRAATREQINALAQEARELATQQAALAEALQKDRAGADQAQQQKQLETRAGDLQKSVSELSGDLERQQEQQAATSSRGANDAIERARQQMQTAAQQAASREQEAAAQGKQAAENLEQAAKSLEAASTAMAEGAEQRANEAMQQALQDAEQLARKQEELRKQMEKAQQQQQGQRGQQQGQQAQDTQQQAQRGQQQGQQGQQGQQAGGGDPMQQLRDQQSALQQEMSRLNQSLAQTADQTGQVSREVGTEMGRANASMQRTTQAMQQAGDQQGMPTREAGQTVESLQRLAQALQRNVQMLQQGDPTSASEQVRQQLGDIAQQQGQLNGRTNALLPMKLNPKSLGQQAGRMAQDQRQIAQRIEQLGEKGASRDDVLGRLDEMAQEAERLARALEGGHPPAEVLSRQERLFHRLLDAGRSLEKDEMSEKRVGEAPGVWTPSSPKALDPTLLQTGDRYRLPTAEELRALPPAYRRMVLEYFGRINRAGGGTGGSDDR